MLLLRDFFTCKTLSSTSFELLVGGRIEVVCSVWKTGSIYSILLKTMRTDSIYFKINLSSNVNLYMQMLFSTEVSPRCFTRTFLLLKLNSTEWVTSLNTCGTTLHKRNSFAVFPSVIQRIVSEFIHILYYMTRLFVSNDTSYMNSDG
jgi:hypothetical protein